MAPALCGWLGVHGNTPLLLGIAFVCASAVPLLWAKNEPRPVHGADGHPPALPFWRFPKETVFLAGLIVALFGGMSEAAFAGMFSLYGRAHQLDAAQIASLLMSFSAGGLLLQYAAGWLADHRGVAYACLCCSVCGALVSVALCFALPFVLLHVAVFALGGLVTAYLTLALTACAKTQGGNMAHKMSVVSMAYTASAIVGPLLAGSAIEALGGNGLMLTLTGFAMLMTACLVWAVVRAGTARGAMPR